MPTIFKHNQWWEIREVIGDRLVDSQRLYVYDAKREALKELRRCRKDHPVRVYKLVRTTEKLEFEYRDD